MEKKLSFCVCLGSEWFSEEYSKNGETDLGQKS